ncbi:MAG: hypothetical protein VYE22_22560 [Myxococcota bacterium]|nr:hypothetical protein [Myxococcota bacterium]
MARRLHLRFCDGEAIPEDLLREVWALRLTMLTLTRSREADWEVFSGFVRGPDRCLFAFVDDDEVVRGFFTIAFLPMEEPGRRDLLMYSKYFYFHRDFRGHPKSILSPWRLLPLTLRRYGPRRLHFVTTAFPQSYVSLARTSGRVFSLRDPGLPAWERRALTRFAQTFCGDAFDEGEGLVGGSNVADSESLPRSPEARALHDRYEALNPRWREGFSLPILFHVDARLIFHNARRVLRRALR